MVGGAVKDGALGTYVSGGVASTSPAADAGEYPTPFIVRSL